MGDALQLVVDEELGKHEEEAKRIDTVHEG